MLWSPTRPEEPGRLVALKHDPDWQDDLWDLQPEVRERLLARARDLPRFAQDAEGNLPGPRENEIDETLRERLRALGYAE